MPRYELDDRAAIVTGGGRNIGRAIAMRLAHEGASVAVADIDGDAAHSVTDEITAAGGQSVAAVVDVADKGQVDEMVAQATAALGRLDIMVNNAGVLTTSPAIDITENDWDRHMAVNAKGVLFCSQAAARQMISQGGGGRIITVVSTAGRLPSSGNTPAAAYVASKHAAMGLIQQMGLELAPQGILMNAVFPGIVETDMVRSLQQDMATQTGETFEAVRARFRDLIPIGRYQAPDEVASMVAFLASSDATYSVGQAFDANGGIAFW